MMVLYEKYLLSGKDKISYLESGKPSQISPYDFSRPRCDLFWREGQEFGHLECLKSKNYAYRAKFGWACVFCKSICQTLDQVRYLKGPVEPK